MDLFLAYFWFNSEPNKKLRLTPPLLRDWEGLRDCRMWGWPTAYERRGESMETGRDFWWVWIDRVERVERLGGILL